MSEQAPPPLILHQRASVGDVLGIAALVEGGCALDLQDRDGNTALHEVSWHGFSDCVKVLVKAGADVNIQNKAGNTALHLSCQNDHRKSARLLLLHKSKPETRNQMGDTCVHVAARYNNVSLLEVLLKSLCSANDTNKAGDSALHVAAALNHKQSVSLLLKFGADIRMKNKRGRTALDEAKDKHYKEMESLLQGALQVQGFRRRKTVWAGRHRRAVQSRTGAPAKEPSVFVVETLRKPAGDQTHLSRQPLQQGSTQRLPSMHHSRKLDTKRAGGRCSCPRELKKLQEQVEATQDEVRLHILNVQEEVHRRLKKMDRRNRHQIKVLDLLSQERARAERRDVMNSMEQKVARSKEDILLTQQAGLKQELNQWRMSCLNFLDAHVAERRPHYKPLPAPPVEPPVEPRLSGVDVEFFPLLSGLSEDSSTSLANYVNIINSKPEPCRRTPRNNRRYFEMKESADDYENLDLYSSCWRRCSLSGSGSACSQVLAGEPHVPAYSLVQQCSVSSSTSSSSSSWSSSSRSNPLLPVREQEEDGGGTLNRDGSTSQSASGDGRHPPGPAVLQEGSTHQAMEVTQHFFSIVSTQLEQWCQRKILEVELQTELRVQQERADLLQHILTLEQEVERLKTSEDTQSTAPVQGGTPGSSPTESQTIPGPTVQGC